MNTKINFKTSTNQEEVRDFMDANIVLNAKQNLLDDEIVYDVADFFKSFSDSSRIKILYALLDAEMCVGDLAELLQMSQSAVSHQLRTLRQNNLVKYRKKGKTVIYSLDDSHVSSLLTQGLEHIRHKNGY